MKIRLVEVEFFRANRRMDEQKSVKKLTVAFSNFANVPKIEGCSITQKQDRQLKTHPQKIQ
jgi:hypothetical protein